MEVAPISVSLDISKPLGRIRVVHYTLKVLQALAAYAPHAPPISMALGGAIKVVGPRGNVVRSVVMFQGARAWCVWQRGSTTNKKCLHKM